MLKIKVKNAPVGCAIWTVLLFIVVNVGIGGWSVDTILNFFGKDIAFIWDALIGLFVAELSIPLAVVGLILKALGVF